jgi:hypothetical protein
MRKALTGTGLTFCTILLLAGCGQSGEEAGSADHSSNSAEAAGEAADADSSALGRSGAPRPPGVSPTAAPGVAFDYRYAFRIPHDRISGVQEQHAATCEKIGVERCRIISMQYESDGEEDVDAQIAFKIDPALARRFGKEGIDAVERAKGKLTSARITGQDVGAQIAEGNRGRAQMEEGLRRIEGELAQPGRRGAERAELQNQAQALRDSLRMNEAAQGERRAMLATTPMVFDYKAGETDTSFGAEMGRAFERLLDSLRALLIFLVYALPWLLALLAAVLAWKWVNRRFLGGPSRRETIRLSSADQPDPAI